MNIRKMKFEDKSEILSMMKIFYSSELVFTNGSDEIFNKDFETCINNSPYLDGHVFTQDETIMGYAMIAKSFSTEFGKPCLWFEDLYLKPEFRGQKIIPQFIKYIKYCCSRTICNTRFTIKYCKYLCIYLKCIYKINH